MCDLDAAYSTLVGPRNQLRRVVEHWYDLRTPRQLGLELRPVLLSLEEMGPQFLDERCPAVAVVRHPTGIGANFSDALQVEILTSFGAPSVIAEPGFTVAAAAAGPGSPSQVTLDHVRVVQAQGAIGAGSGTRVAVLDSGDAAASAMVDFTGGNPRRVTPGEDPFGHGTAVIALIRALRPAASIECVRVLGPTGRADSFELFQALTYAHWGGRFDVVNASLTNQLAGICAVGLGKSIGFIVEQSRQQSPATAPHLVAAAGNTPSARRLGYPALVPDAVVVTSIDWSGADAGYNVMTPPGIATRAAFGGTAGAPFGHMATPRGAHVELFGTSYAAAVVTASFLA